MLIDIPRPKTRTTDELWKARVFVALTFGGVKITATDELEIELGQETILFDIFDHAIADGVIVTVGSNVYYTTTVRPERLVPAHIVELRMQWDWF